MALLFMNGGWLAIPLNLSSSLAAAITRLGGSTSGVRTALSATNGTFVRMDTVDGEKGWRFRHPTIADALAQYFADDPDLVDVYLSGADPGKMLSELVCGQVEIEGAKVHVPFSRCDMLLDRLQHLVGNNSLSSFLAQRCDDRFLRAFAERFPQLPEVCMTRLTWPLRHCSHARLLGALWKANLLNEDNRVRLVREIKNGATRIPDASFLKVAFLRRVLLPSEIHDVLEYVRTSLTENASTYVNAWSDGYDSHDEAAGALEEAKEELSSFRKHGDKQGVDLSATVREAIEWIDEKVTELREEPDEDYDEDDEGWWEKPHVEEEERSIFDDVDE